MHMKIKQSILLSLLAPLLLAGCRAVATPAASQLQTTATALSTQQIQFDPMSITPSTDQPVQAGECGASLRVLRSGAYSCTTATGALFDPCFVLAPGGNLGCQPNPVASRYSALVSATNTPLPDTVGVPQPVPFYLTLGPGKPSCSVGLNAPMQLDGREVTWRCEAPGAWIVGDLRTDQPGWLADYVVTDSSGIEITYGPEETLVEEAWTY
jgi:hypothetical protein